MQAKDPLLHLVHGHQEDAELEKFMEGQRQTSRKVGDALAKKYAN